MRGKHVVTVTNCNYLSERVTPLEASRHKSCNHFSWIRRWTFQLQFFVNFKFHFHIRRIMTNPSSAHSATTIQWPKMFYYLQAIKKKKIEEIVLQVLIQKFRGFNKVLWSNGSISSAAFSNPL